MSSFCFSFPAAAGLYYLAELVEEYTVMTAKVIRWATVVRGEQTHSCHSPHYQLNIFPVDAVGVRAAVAVRVVPAVDDGPGGDGAAHAPRPTQLVPILPGHVGALRRQCR